MAKPAPATKQAQVRGKGRIPGAPPTAPGGMSEANLRIELKEKHGVSMDESRAMTWPEKIERVIVERRLREAEAKTAPQPEPEPEKSLAAEEYDAVMEGLCPHAEDPDLCEACEDALLGGDEDDEEEDEVSDDLYVEAEALADALAEPLADIAAQVDAMIEADPSLVEQAKARTKRGPLPEGTIIHYNEPVAEPDDSLDDLDPETWLNEASSEREDFEATLPPSLFLGMPGVHDYLFSGHAGTGPSGAERWMNCTASLGMSRKFLERLSQNQQIEFAGANMAARQGTTAHSAAEVEARVILGEMDAVEAEHHLFELAINPPDGEDYTPEMAQFITEYTDLIKMYVDDGHEVLIEERVEAAVPLTAPLTVETREFMGLDSEDGDYYVVPGSVDCGVMPTEDTPVLTAVDLKYGEGKDVDPDSNPQVRIYMLGLLAKFIERGGDLDDLERLDYVIAQPRLGGIKTWTESVEDLLTWRDDVLSPALTAALGLVPSEFSPGEDTCQWCPARGGCAALANARVEAAAELFTELDEAEFGDGPGVVATDLDSERLASLLKQITGLVDLKDDLKAEAQRRMYRGEKVPGMVLVNYTPARSWKTEAAEFFADEDNAHLPVWREPTLVTPTAFVKAMAAEFDGKNAKEREAAAQAKFSRFIEVPDKRPVVAFEGDKRSLWTDIPPDQMFPDLDDEEG